MLFDTVVFDGELSLDLCVDADCELLIPEGGEAGTVIKVNEGAYPAYTGATNVVPLAAAEQVLETANKTVLANITVEKIPVHITTNPQGGNTVYIGGDIAYG